MASKLQRSQRFEEEEEIPEKSDANSLPKKPAKPPRPPPRRAPPVRRANTLTTSLTNGPSGRALRNLKGSHNLRPFDRGAVNHAATFDATSTTSRRGANRIVAMNTIPGAIPDSFDRTSALRSTSPIDLERLTLYNERTRLKPEQIGIVPEPTPRLYATTLASAFGGLIIGYDLEVISLTLPRITHDVTLTSVGQQLSVSLTLGLAALSALLAGLLAERLGRRAVTLTACILYMSASLCLALSHNQPLLLAGRVMSGCSLGFISMATPVYLAELAPPLIRGRMVTLFFVFLAAGQLLADVINACLLGVSNGWRIMLGLGMLPAFIHLVTVALMPETPHWLVQHGRLQDAKQVLVRMRKNKEVAEELERIRVACEDAEVMHVQNGELPALWQILTTPWVRRALFMGCILHIILQCTGFAVIRNSNRLVIKMGATFDDVTASWLSCAPGAIFFLSVFIGFYFVEKVGRRPLTLASILGIVISLSWLAVGFHLSSIYSPSVESSSSNGPCSSYRTCTACTQDSTCGFCFNANSSSSLHGSCSSLPPGGSLISDNFCNATSRSVVLPNEPCPSNLYWMPLVGLFVYYLFLGSGLGPAAYVYNTEIYPVWARCSGMAVATSTSWLCNLIITLTYPAFTENITIYGTLWIYACLVLAGLVFLWFFLPETQGKPLEETEGAFAHAWCGEDAPTKKDPSETVQYVHIRGLNRDCQDSEDIESPE